MPKLTAAERTILINQYRILGALQDDHENAYKTEITILDRGYEDEYEEHIFNSLSEPFEAEDSKFVVDIMWLYYLMKIALNQDVIKDPGGDRDEQGGLRMQNLEPKFPGFDGNNQSRELAYAKFLIERDQFSEHNHYLNSHGSQPNYKRMWSKFLSLGRPLEMSEEQANEILASGRG